MYTTILGRGTKRASHIRKGDKKSFSRRKDGGQVGGGGGLKRGRCESPDLKKRKKEIKEMSFSHKGGGGQVGGRLPRPLT
jgi:hypothetical protein